MATDAEFARKLQLEEFQRGDSTDPDAQLAWHLQQNEVEVDDLDSGSLHLDQLSPDPVSQSSDIIDYDHPIMDDLSPDSITDEVGYGQATAQSEYQVDTYSVHDDERIAFQLEEQLKLTQEHEDAELAQKLYEEEEHNHTHSRATRPPTLPRREPPQRNRPPRHALFPPYSGSGRHHVFDPTFSPPETDMPFNIRGPHHHHHLPRHDFDCLRPSMFGTRMRNHVFPRNMLPQEDVDLNDYEALWELAETIGNVKDNGVTQEVIDGLKSGTFTKDAHGAMSQKTDHECRICLSTFSEGENVKILPCSHMYHKSCIDNWLKRKGDCPICRENVKPES